MANTPHIGLHQWQPNDSFLREEFNEDFAKIDAAVGALQTAMPSVVLRRHVTGTAVRQVDVSLTDIRFEEYRRLEIDFIPPPGAQNIQAMVRFNEKAAATDYSLTYWSGGGGQTDCFAYFTLGDNSGSVTLDCTGRSISGHYREIGVNGVMHFSYMSPFTGVKLADLRRVNLVGYGSTYIPAGTQINIYGVRR